VGWYWQGFQSFFRANLGTLKIHTTLFCSPGLTGSAPVIPVKTLGYRWKMKREPPLAFWISRWTSRISGRHQHRCLREGLARTWFRVGRVRKHLYKTRLEEPRRGEANGRGASEQSTDDETKNSMKGTTRLKTA
jgi:hypothetical protein